MSDRGKFRRELIKYFGLFSNCPNSVLAEHMRNSGHGFSQQTGRPSTKAMQNFLKAVSKLPASSPKKPRPKKEKFVYVMPGELFYASREWREIRYKALKRDGRRCVCCGATPEDGMKMHVDHIKPRSKYPELELELSNLQILCEDCNLGKSNKDETDWRAKMITDISQYH